MEKTNDFSQTVKIENDLHIDYQYVSVPLGTPCSRSSITTGTSCSRSLVTSGTCSSRSAITTGTPCSGSSITSGASCHRSSITSGTPCGRSSVTSEVSCSRSSIIPVTSCNNLVILKPCIVKLTHIIDFSKNVSTNIKNKQQNQTHEWNKQKCCKNSRLVSLPRNNYAKDIENFGCKTEIDDSNSRQGLSVYDQNMVENIKTENCFNASEYGQNLENLVRSDDNPKVASTSRDHHQNMNQCDSVTMADTCTEGRKFGIKERQSRKTKKTVGLNEGMEETKIGEHKSDSSESDMNVNNLDTLQENFEPEKFEYENEIYPICQDWRFYHNGSNSYASKNFGEYMTWNAVHKCPICEKVFMEKTDFQIHIRKVSHCKEIFTFKDHVNKKLLFHCRPCKFETKNRKMFWKHLLYDNPHGELGHVSFPKRYDLLYKDDREFDSKFTLDFEGLKKQWYGINYVNADAETTVCDNRVQVKNKEISDLPGETDETGGNNNISGPVDRTLVLGIDVSNQAYISSDQKRDGDHEKMDKIEERKGEFSERVSRADHGFQEMNEKLESSGISYNNGSTICLEDEKVNGSCSVEDLTKEKENCLNDEMKEQNGSYLNDVLQQDLKFTINNDSTQNINRFEDITEIDENSEITNGTKDYNEDIDIEDYVDSDSVRSQTKNKLQVKSQIELSCCGINEKDMSDVHVNGYIKETPLSDYKFKVGYFCKECKGVFRNKKVAYDHIKRQHTCELTHKCDICGQKFIHQNDLKKHKEIHGGNKVQCEVCGLSFTCQSTLRRHMPKHTGIKKVANYKYSCQFCDKKFRKIFRRDDHHRVHTGEKPFICEECGVTYRTKEALRQHKNLRHEDRSKKKEFRCKVCGKVFIQSKSLSLHKRSHQDRQHVCEICNKSFVLPHHLRTHMLSHNKIKSFKCSLCGFAFTLKHHLQAHMKTKHDTELFQIKKGCSAK